MTTAAPVAAPAPAPTDPIPGPGAPIRLRPHHVLCILTFLGKGYTPGFTVNMNAVVRRLAAGAEIEVVTGPDDICAPLLVEQEQPHCHRESVTARDDRAAADVARLLQTPIQPGARLVLTAERLRQLRNAYAAGPLRGACSGCDWSDLCAAVANAGFSGAVLQIP
ncbi:DUF1284 domain-containing protein [Roseospira marina]|uniref:DUF1284 domain-containing protein n=1 Tax=Roseospira marina TaxID=140057 RepID=UPI0017F8D097|nr:DUF1284 domain-containing protein [Roseospira marina]MBB4314027.1 hypothetical protein [Roseospira marina]MBB5087188.1 hypothetical protein [Roseospira marina]